MAVEDSERRPGLVLSGLSDTSRMEWLGSQRAARYWRLLFSGIWLIYVVQPIGSLFRHHYGAAYIGGAIAIVVVFCLCYLNVWSVHEISRRQHDRNSSPRAVVPLFVLAALACVIYDGAKWNALWIYVSAACGAISADRRVAVRAVPAAGGCYVFFSWIGHDAVSDFLFTLLPVLLVGFAMIGFRAQIMMMRELRQARETVARLAASEERLRLARDMHDLTGQSLSMITLKSELAGRLLQGLPGTRERDRAREEIEQVAAVSRQTLHDIREAALAWCLREAVTNVIRHSGARHCYLSLARDGDALALTVRDDGRGGILSPARAAFYVEPQPDARAGAGLRGMSERLAAVGGRCSSARAATGSASWRRCPPAKASPALPALP